VALRQKSSASAHNLGSSNGFQSNTLITTN
jgi:hypothetical protein